MTDDAGKGGDVGQDLYTRKETKDRSFVIVGGV